LVLAGNQAATAKISNPNPSPDRMSWAPTTTLSPTRQDPEDERWADEFGVSGPDSVVYALAADHQGNIYASGEFVTIAGKTVNHIARWDGSTWSALGDGLEAASGKLAVDSQGNLYTDILSYTAEGTPVTQIAQWNGSSWITVGGDLGPAVDSLAEGRDSNIVINALVVDNQDKLYAGGYFYLIQRERYVGFVARWDGSTWTVFGGSMNHTVYSLAADDDGNVYAGGEFSAAGGIPAKRIAKWDGNSWSALGNGFEDTPRTLVTDHDGNLYAAVDGFISRWDGSTWSTLGRAGGDEIAIYSLALGQGHILYVGGVFTSMDGVAARYIARWDGTSWTPLGSGMNREVYGIAVAPNGLVYAGGFFSQAGGRQASYIARWDGQSWAGLGGGNGNGMNMAVNALATDGSGNLYAAGYFSFAGDTQANRIARWDGSSWSALGSGVNDTIYSLAVDGQGNLYAGGAFNTAGGVPAKCIAKWDGSSWSALGSGLDGWYIGALLADGDGNLYAGGDFTTAGEVEANFIAKWDGSSWQALDGGMNDRVNALALDVDGNLYAGGWFTEAGGREANGIARWDGNSWSALGSGMGDVWALAVDRQGMLYAGGGFTSAGGVAANHIARWDGATWSPLGNGMEADLSSYPYPRVAALAVDHEDNLYAGGDFTVAGGAPANHIAMWDGSSWSPLGSGVVGRSNGYIILSLAWDGNENLYAGGDFLYAGGKPSANIARWFAGRGVEGGTAVVAATSTEPMPTAIGNRRSTTPTELSGADNRVPVLTPAAAATKATATTHQDTGSSPRIAFIAIAALVFSIGIFSLIRWMLHKG
jgi:hypothetical protein